MSIKYLACIFIITLHAMKIDDAELNSLLQAVRMGTLELKGNCITYPHYSQEEHFYTHTFNETRTTLLEIITYAEIIKRNFATITESLKTLRTNIDKTFEQKKEDVEELFNTLPEKEKLTIHLHHFTQFIENSNPLKKILTNGNLKKFKQYYHNKIQKAESSLPAILKHMETIVIGQVRNQEVYSIPLKKYEAIHLNMAEHELHYAISSIDAYITGNFIQSTLPNTFLYFPHFQSPTITYKLLKEEVSLLLSSLRKASLNFYKKPLYLTSENKQVNPPTSHYMELTPEQIIRPLPSQAESFKISIKWPLEYYYKIQLERIFPLLNLDSDDNNLTVEEKKQWLMLQQAFEDEDSEKIQNGYKAMRSRHPSLMHYLQQGYSKYHSKLKL